MNNSAFKKLLEKIPFNRWMIYMVALGFLPVVLAGIHAFHKKQEWNEVSEHIQALQSLAETRARKQYLNTIVRNTFAEADQHYFENQLEGLPLLKKERENLEQLLRSPTFTGNESAEKRYAFLISNSNQITFTQAAPLVGDNIQETTCSLSHPVEVDIQDLKEILTRIEGNRKGKPQLILTDFKLNKKAQTSGNEVFELNMKVLKREFQS